MRALVAPARSPYSSLVGQVLGKSDDFYCTLLTFWAHPPVGLRFLYGAPSAPSGPKLVASPVYNTHHSSNRFQDRLLSPPAPACHPPSTTQMC